MSSHQSSEEQSISPAEGRAGNPATDTINTSNLPRGSEQSREEIARVIERTVVPDWSVDSIGRTGAFLRAATVEQAADAILALSTAHAEGLGKEEEYGVQTHGEKPEGLGEVRGRSWRAAPRSPRSQWQPIESAPHRALIVAADHAREYWAIGCINADGEFEQTERDGAPRGIGFYPTHWMPLPAPPSSGGEG